VNLVSVTISDPTRLGAAVRTLEESRIPFLHLSMRQPSLDEVFFALTGHPAEPMLEEEKALEGSTR
jgi:hypothetical protein